MSYADEEKRAFCIGKIIEFLNTLDTWEKFKAFVIGVSPDKLKAKLIEGHQDAQVEDDLVISSAQEKKIADETMVNEINEIT